MPRVTFRGPTVIVADEETSQERVIDQLQRVGSWTFMGVFGEGPATTAVFEQLDCTNGRIAFLSEDGTLLELGKSLEPTDKSSNAWYRGHHKNAVLPGQPDILRYELLEGGRDPDPEEVRACFPPVRRAFWEGVERPHTFIGTPTSADVIPVYYRDVPMVSRVPPEVVAPEIREAIAAETIWEGLVGGWLPVVRTVYPIGENECWELIAFASAERATTHWQPAWYRFTKLSFGKVEEIKYIDSFLPYPNEEFADPGQFYQDLLSTHNYWQEQLAGAMALTVPEDWIGNFCRHALVLERITRMGAHPKYGVVDRAYGGQEHDGFQDELTATVICALEWGLFAAARGYLDYYFRHFVRLDGSIRYRGPRLANTVLY